MLFDNTTEPKYIVGFDLRDDYCQISWFEQPKNGITREPMTYSLIPGEEDYNIPTALCKLSGRNRWFAGREAAQAASKVGGTYVSGLLSMALAGNPVKIEEGRYEPVSLLALYIKRCLSFLDVYFQPHQLSALMFTTRHMDERMLSVLEAVKTRLSIKCEVYYEEYANSYFQYMLMQAKNLREPGSILCEYDGSAHIRLSKLIINMRTRPEVAYVEDKVFTFPGTSIAAAKTQPSGQEAAVTDEDIAMQEEKDSQLARILAEEIERPAAYASAYLVGTGFQDGWMKKSLQILCRGRRAFMGNNLYSKGACYGGYLRLETPAASREYYFLDSNHLKTNVGVRAYVHGELTYFALLDAGINWYEVDSTSDIILEDGNEIELLLTPLTGGEAKIFPVRLEKLIQREGRTTRIRMHFTMPSSDHLHLELEDMGFGEIFPSSGRKWEQEITII